uniref:hypothetical protein n=1 Tax=Bacteroides acidifaciens TaxID=85831 RepID=UPI00217D279A|nr:hypothetical protein [Bacteroides acidifaciens]
MKQLSVGKLSDLYDSFREMIIKCVKIGISKDAIMQFINKALEIGLLDNERFTNIKVTILFSALTRIATQRIFAP